MKATASQWKAPDGGNGAPVLASAVFALDDIHCWLCAETLQQTLSEVAGVVNVTVHPITGRTAIAYNPAQVRGSDLLQAIRCGGFDPRPSGHEEGG